MEGIKIFLSLCLLVFFAQGVQSQICAKNWKLHNDMYYTEVSTRMSYSEAKTNCLEMGAKLAILKSPDENNFVKDLSCRPALSLYRYWIAMDDLLNENNFQWEDGTQVNPQNSRWGPGEPNNRWNQDCVSFITSPDPRRLGKWSTEVCSSNLLSLCSKPLVLPKLSNSPDVYDIGTDSFRLRWRCWNKIEDTGDGPVLGYRIHVNTVQGPTVANWITVGLVLVGEPCEFVIEHLHINTKYYVAVSVLHGDSMREGPLGPRLLVSTRNVVLPKLSNSPDVYDIGTDSFRLRWRCWNEIEDTGDGPVLGYRIHVNTVQDPTVATWITVGFVLVGEPCEFVIKYLHTNTKYYVAVSVLHGDSMREGPLGPRLLVRTRNVDPGPDIICRACPACRACPVAVKTGEKAPSNTRLILGIGLPMTFCAGIAFTMLLSYWCRRRIVYVNNE